MTGRGVILMVLGHFGGDSKGSEVPMRDKEPQMSKAQLKKFKDMLEAKRSPTQESSGETEAAASKGDAGIVPMGIPMLAGPGAITSVMVLVGQAQDFKEHLAIYGAITITAAVCFLVLGSAVRVARILGQTGIRILVRIMGLLLVALAVQDFVNGLVDLNVINKP